VFYQTRDEDLFKTFWFDELTNTPRHFQDASHVWHTSWDDFKAFCDGMWRIYSIEDKALVYVEHNGNVHFSLLRGTDTSNLVNELIGIRNELLLEKEYLYGWVGKHNRGMQRIVEDIGFQWHGFTMYHGQSHGKILEWRCYVLDRRDFYVEKDTAKLLVSV